MLTRPKRSRYPSAAAAGSQDLAVRLFGGNPERTLALLRAAWPAAVGPELSRRTEVLALEGRVLRVRVPDAGWRKVLHRMRTEILAKLRETAGSLAPKALGFHEGQVTADPSPRRVNTPPDPLATPRVPASIEDASAAIADPDLREHFRAVAARYLKRQASVRGPHA